MRLVIGKRKKILFRSKFIYKYEGTLVSYSEFERHREQFRPLKSLWKNKSFIITSSGVVILDYQNYAPKMMLIFGDTIKFSRFGPVDAHDYTVSVETKFQKNFVKCVKSGFFPSTISDLIRLIGPIRSCFYGLPKTHKDGVPLRPILSMMRSSQHKFAKWLTAIFQPMLDYYNIYCIENSFDFFSFRKGYSLTDKFRCSFDVYSLFTCWFGLVWCVGFYGISTFVGDLTPNPFLCK